MVEAEALTKDYRLNPEDGVLERAVDVSKARIWVPVMPALAIPSGFFAKPRDEITWRRYAFEMAHATFLEPHRSSSSSWQALKRIGFWQSMYKDFNVWVNNCAVCHQYRTVGVTAPMRSTLKSLDEFTKLQWRDVIEEAEHQGHHTPVVQIGHRYGMTLFIASEVMFFVAWFWAYFNASLFPTESIGGTWPPPDIKTFDPWDIPLINTLILLLSGTTVTWAHHAMLENDRKGLVNGLIATVFLGFIFSCFQAYEYHHATFTLDGNIYGSTFYMATGFHGFHVIVGTIFLAVCLFRSMKGHSTPTHHFGFEAAAWYWHFVDVVWLFLFAAIYIWGS